MTKFKFQIKSKAKEVMLNPESVILNLIQNLFRAGLFQHLIKIIILRDPETSSDLMIEKTYDLCHGELFTWCYESSEILPFRPAPLHLRAPG